MNEIFSFKEPSYHFRNDNIFVRNNDRTMTYGTKTIYLLGSNLTPGTVYQENKKLNHYINLKKKNNQTGKQMDLIVAYAKHDAWVSFDRATIYFSIPTCISC